MVKINHVSIYLNDEDKPMWDLYVKYCKAMNKKVSQALREFAFSEVARFQGKDPNVVSVVQLETLENDYVKVTKEIRDLRMFLMKTESRLRNRTSQSAYEILNLFAEEIMGIRNNRKAPWPSYEEVLKKFYTVKLENYPELEEVIDVSSLELFIQLLEKNKKQKDIYKALVAARGSQGENAIKKLETAIEKEAEKEIHESNEDTETDKVPESVPIPEPAPDPEPVIETEETEEEEQDQEEEEEERGFDNAGVPY